MLKVEKLTQLHKASGVLLSYPHHPQQASSISSCVTQPDKMSASISLKNNEKQTVKLAFWYFGKYTPSLFFGDLFD